MSTRTLSQKIGAQGQRLVASLIEKHPHWLARELGEDYGIDLEAELTECGVRGEILKLQIKSSQQIERNDVAVRVVIESKYLSYADACRYPVILVVADIDSSEA